MDKWLAAIDPGGKMSGELTAKQRSWKIDDEWLVKEPGYNKTIVLLTKEEYLDQKTSGDGPWYSINGGIVYRSDNPDLDTKFDCLSFGPVVEDIS